MSRRRGRRRCDPGKDVVDTGLYSGNEYKVMGASVWNGLGGCGLRSSTVLGARFGRRADSADVVSSGGIGAELEASMGPCEVVVASVLRPRMGKVAGR